MISKFPKWVWVGGSALAFIAGCINAIGFLGFRHQGITHLTGTTTLLGMALEKGQFSEGLQLAAMAFAFFSGCALGGFLIQDSALKLGRRYGVGLILESAMLFAAVPCLNNGNAFGYHLACCACGLQNGMASTYSGAVLRTSHVSGIYTDLGILIGQLLRGVKVDMLRVRFLFSLLLSFFGGAMAGALAFQKFHYATLYFPATMTGCVGFAYGFYRQRKIQTGEAK